MTDARARALAALALVFNAFAWGVSWWPFRELQGLGLHPLWATALIYTVAAAAITLARPAAWRQLATTRSLWPLVLASGLTNACFNWAVTIGDVVRVVLLFYLMPLWAVLLARLVLHEALTRLALVRVALALTGAMVVLWPDGQAVVHAAGHAAGGAGGAAGGAAGGSAGGAAGTALSGLPLPRTLAEWLGVAGGFGFALNNVLLRREARQPEGARALAMFVGGAGVAVVLALALGASGGVAPLPAPAPAWLAGAIALALWFLAGNLALQFGAARLPANATAVIMITEVLFASVSAVLLGAGALTPALALGGGLIVLAALLAARG